HVGESRGPCRDFTSSTELNRPEFSGGFVLPFEGSRTASWWRSRPILSGPVGCCPRPRRGGGCCTTRPGNRIAGLPVAAVTQLGGRPTHTPPDRGVFDDHLTPP